MEMRNINVGASLRVLGHAVKDLQLINRIDRDLLIDNHKIIYDTLWGLKQKGYKGFETLEGMAACVDSSEEKEKMITTYEVLKRYMEVIESSSFEADLAASGVSKSGGRLMVADVLAQKRAKVLEDNKNEFVLDAFPLPVRSGKMNLIVSPSNGGKTIYSTALALELARGGKKVMLVSTEEGEDSFYENTMAIDENEELWGNVSFQYIHRFNKQDMRDLIVEASSAAFEFVVIDYLKKSMWNNYTSDHVVMEEINSTIINALNEVEGISVFAFIQANRGAYNWTLEDFRDRPGESALLIDGGMPAFRSADSVVFIKPELDKNRRYLVVCKTRGKRFADLRGKAISYNVDLDSFKVNIFGWDSQPDLVSSGVKKNKGKGMIAI